MKLVVCTVVGALLGLTSYALLGYLAKAPVWWFVMFPPAYSVIVVLGSIEFLRQEARRRGKQS